MAKGLRLTAIRYGGEPQSGMSAEVGPAVFAIGRGAGNDWVLPDPEKHVSNRHCIIERHDGQYSITDFSANGVFINGAEQALGHGRSSLLNSGDRLAIGDYEIAVEFDAVSSELASSPVFGEMGALSIDAIRGSRMEEPFPSRIDPMPAPQTAPVAAAAWMDEAPSGRPEPFPPAAEIPSPFGGSDLGSRGAPDADHLPAVNSYFRVPDLQPPIIPADWNAARTEDDPAANEPAIQQISEPEAPHPPPPAASAEGSQQDRPRAADRMAQPLTDEIAAQGLRAFLQGAGLPDAAIGSLDAAACLHRYGELFRELAAGVRELLAARALMKSEFRIPQTLIHPSGNNPLKFSVDLEQALQALLVSRSNGYAEPLTAVREAVADLRAHEVGVIAGMQKAAAKLLGALAPAALETRIDASGLLGSLVPAARKARCWEAYEAVYHEVAADLEEDVQGAFRDAFATAYAEQVKKL
jgi:type VI secretion system protein